MSTKRLEKTVIEGGRRTESKERRRRSNRPERASQRAFLSKVRKDPLNAEFEIIEERDPIYKEFSDKLNPMHRWLDAQVGRLWADVRSEIAVKFDTRSVAGRHITYDHLLANITDTLSGRDDRGFIAENQTSWSNRYHSYYVDGAGLLQRCAVREPGWWPGSKNEAELKAAAEWLMGRMIGEKGGVLYWFHNLDGVWKAEWNKIEEVTKWGPREGPLTLKYFSYGNSSYEKKFFTPYLSINSGYYHTVKRTGLHWEMIKNPAGFKQRGPLSPEEVKHFRTFHVGMQREILAFGKTRI